MTIDEIRVGSVVTGPLLPEPVEVLAIVPLGDSVKLIGKGCKTGLVRDPVLTPAQLAQLRCSPLRESFDGDPALFRLGIEAQRLGLAYEYDPYFSLSIARVDPLPHQLEAVYDYFLKLPRIRFLLADDPGAGKTIMAGLLLKELKARGLVRRTLDRRPGQPDLPVAAGAEGQVPRELRGHPGRDAADQLRPEPLAGPRPGHHVDLLGLPGRGRQGEPAPLALGPHRRGRGPQDERLRRRPEDAGLPARRVPLRHDRPLPADDGHAAQGRRRELLPVPGPARQDVYGNVKSLEDAMRRGDAPFYLRRTKEALVTFPDPDTGEVKKLFTKREVKTTTFELNDEEFDFYDALTRYVEDQSIRASADDSAAGRAVGFIMAMLQRRMASSVYAVRRSLERMKRSREEILADPEAYRRQRIERRIPDDFDELPDDEQADLLARLEDEVVSVDPAVLREEIARLVGPDRPGQAPGDQGRDQARQAPQRPDRARDLRRPAR